MRGLAAFRDLSVDKLRVTMELTRRAIDLDPHFGRALALRALCIQHLQSDEAEDPEAMAEALRLAHAALAASSDDWEAASFAATVISSMGGSIETALSASQRALTLNPSGFLALMHNGWIQCIAGNPAAAIDPFTRARRLSPRDRFGGFCEAGLGVAYRDVGQPQEALVWARRAIMSLPALGKRIPDCGGGTGRPRPHRRGERANSAVVEGTSPGPYPARICPPPQSHRGHGRSLDCRAADGRIAGPQAVFPPPRAGALGLTTLHRSGHERFHSAKGMGATASGQISRAAKLV
jgi:tetratricopeptide (TPR) repeat protein